MLSKQQRDEKYVKRVKSLFKALRKGSVEATKILHAELWSSIYAGSEFCTICKHSTLIMRILPSIKNSCFVCELNCVLGDKDCNTCLLSHMGCEEEESAWESYASSEPREYWWDLVDMGGKL